MDVASFCSLPVGVLEWNAPRPVTTVIVKATFTMESDGSATLADVQQPLCLDQPLAESDSELYYGTDFVPLKKAVDVLAVGRAWSPEPRISIPFTVSVGSMVAQMVARGDRSARTHPLLARNLREQVPGPAANRRLAPVAHGVSEWLDRTLASDFDFSSFNAAPEAHRVSDSVAGKRLVLEGLLSGAPLREVELPSLPPALFRVPDRKASALYFGERVTLACDTLWIDADRKLLTMTWRGVMQQARVGDARPLLVIALPDSEQGPSWAGLVPHLRDAQWYPAATEESSSPLEPAGPVPLAPPVPKPRSWFSSSADPDATELLDVEAARRQADSLPQPEGEDGARAESQRPGSNTAPMVDPDDTIQNEATAALDQETEDDGIEPAPITPRAGLRLGQQMGFSLGGALLGRAEDDDPLPFAAAGAEADRPPSDPPAALDEPPPARSPQPTRILELDDQLAAARLKPTPFAPGSATAAAPTPMGAKHPDTSLDVDDPITAETPGTSYDDLDEATVAANGEALPPQQALPFASGSPNATTPAASELPSEPPAGPFGPGLAPLKPVPSPPPGRLSAPVRPPQPKAPPAQRSVPRPAAPDEQRDDSARRAAGSTVPMPTVARYAAIKVALWDQQGLMDAVLDDYGLDESSWRSIERRQATAIARDASSGGRLAVQIREAIAAVRAEQAKASSAPELSLDEFAELRVAVDDTDEPSLVLTKRGLSPVAWERLQRIWSHRAKADGRVAAELRRKLAAVRLGDQDED